MISIIIPVYNGEKYLQRCIDSIRHQTYTDFEVIIVDDGSTDGSASICDNVARQDDKFQVIHQSNAGVSEARNVALAKAKGDVTFIDADDYVDSTYLEKLKKGLDYADIDIAFCAWKEEDEAYNIITVKTLEQDIIIPSSEYEWNGKLQHPMVWGGIFRNDIIKGVKFDKRFFVGEDTVFLAHCLKKARNLYFLSDPVYHYVQYHESACHGSFNLKKVTRIYAWKEICDLYRESYVENKVKAAFASAIKNFCCIYYPDANFLTSGCLEELMEMYHSVQSVYFKELIRNRKFKDLITGVMFGSCPKLFLRIREEMILLKNRKV